MFNIGDRICYPLHGVGIIEAIEERTVLGVLSSYYVLRFSMGRMTAMVPVDTAEQVGLRHIISGDECAKVIASFKAEPCAESENWNKRYRENYDKLKRGNIYEVAEVVKRLSMREERRGLSAGEHKMLTGARQVLLAELAQASGSSENEIAVELGIRT